ncbi:hypothetical protein KHA93_16395 [Bacillus sp. FJAT-49732]|uniref:Lipoprotein n=1 Tax=Lederbergia citrisecunda TaxID=2833583 RepID=A0A942TS37_9BACI|nr:hypothetical protein [Lederbergia citrisecunda]MBS4201219.1 hypothetical protein [Lederbergia citrisecunda]
MLKRKRMLLKQFSLMLAILLMFFSISGCGKSEEKGGTPPVSNQEGKSPEKVDDETPPSPKDDLVDLDTPPVATGMTQYIEVKGKAYEMLEPMMESISQKNPMASITLMGLFSTDITLAPLAVLSEVPKTGKNVWEGPIMNQVSTGHVEMKGDICTFNMEMNVPDESIQNMTISGEYDTKTESLQASFSVDGKEIKVFEYVPSGSGYVSQIITKENEETYLIKQVFNENTLYIGMVTGSGKEESIYKQNIEFNKNFVKNDSMMVVIENGKGYTIIDNEKYEY